MVPLVALVLSLLCLSASAASPRATIYNRQVAPKGWSKHQEARGNEMLEFTMIFRHDNVDEIEQLFWAVSTPGNPKYGQFLTNEEIIELHRLNDGDRNQVLRALRSHGINEDAITYDAGDSLRIKAPVSRLASFFNTKFYNFVHTRTGARTIRQWGEYSVPAAIKSHINMILGIHTFPTTQQRLEMTQARKMREAASHTRLASLKRDAVATPVYVPQSMGALYGMPSLTPGSNTSVSAAVVEFGGETFLPADLDTFAKNVAIGIIQPTSDHIVGNNTEAPEGIEAALDIQWITGVNPALEPWFWLETDENAWIYTFTVDFLAAKTVPQILSVSYGLPETMQCSYFNPSDCNGLSYTDYITEVDGQFRKIGLAGVSAIICSQDRGTYMSTGAGPAVFTPEYPGTSAYVTSVGATETHDSVYKLENAPPVCSSHSSDGWQCVSGGTEAAVSYTYAGYLSGGGFSNAVAQPSYQAAAVKAYMNSGVKLPDNSLWNQSGRGFPDVAAIGTNGYIVQGSDTLVGGTSMSTPIIAAVVGLLQADYMAVTKKPLGFLNPLIYEAWASDSTLFNDITIGDNCQSDKCSGPAMDGFLTAKGWDPVTGLGSPNVPKLRQYITSHAMKQVAKQGQTAAF